MKEFISTKNQNFTFGDCVNCEAKCCNGKKGTVFSQILAEEFEKVYKNFPILFIFGDLDFIKPVVILTNGNDFCPYLIDFKCSIYEKRPTVCRTYPLSPNIDNEVYIDTLCPEVNKGSLEIIENNNIHLSFNNEVFNNYQDKYINTHFIFEKFKREDFKFFNTLNNQNFYIFNNDSESKYIKMHKKSLSNLDKFFK